MTKVKIPYYLNKPMSVLWFESDELIIGMLLYVMASTVGGYVSIVLAILSFLAYRRFRVKAGRGFINHIPHIMGFKQFKGFPHAYVSKWEE